jgi:transposase
VSPDIKFCRLIPTPVLPRKADRSFAGLIVWDRLTASSAGGRSLPRGPPMPRPLPLPVRQAIWQRCQRGQTVMTIAHALGLAPRTVRHLVHRFQLRGAGAVAPSYGHGSVTSSDSGDEVRQEALALRQQHPTWGAGLIRVMLRRQRGAEALPSERTLQRWLHEAGLGPAPAGRRPTPNPRRAQAAHEVWQMDAKERVKLKTGSRVSWLRIVDECSGAVLWTAVFPPRELGASPP